MKPAPYAYERATTTAQAVALLAAAGDRFVKPCGGAQSLGPMLNLRLAQVDAVVDVSRIPALRAWSLHDDVLRVGAAVTHAQVEDGVLPDVSCGLLPAVAAHIAYRAVRNRGTLGGSVAHADPAADWVSVTCLLDATMLIQGPRGERRVRAQAFYTGAMATALQPDEILAAVEIPVASPQARWGWRKLCRKPGEFAQAIAGVWLDPGRGVARVVLGALDRMPQVLEGAAAVAALQRPQVLTALLDAAGIADAYKREVHTALLRRALQEAGA